MKAYSVVVWFNSGVKPNKSVRTDEELNKVKTMVKTGNYNHPELVVLPGS
jgi:hypothetical protein